MTTGDEKQPDIIRAGKLLMMGAFTIGLGAVLLMILTEKGDPDAGSDLIRHFNSKGRRL